MVVTHFIDRFIFVVISRAYRSDTNWNSSPAPSLVSDPKVDVACMAWCSFSCSRLSSSCCCLNTQLRTSSR